MKVAGTTTDKTHPIRQKTLRFSGGPVISQMYCKLSLHKFSINPFSMDQPTYQSL